MPMINSYQYDHGHHIGQHKRLQLIKLNQRPCFVLSLPKAKMYNHIIHDVLCHVKWQSGDVMGGTASHCRWESLRRFERTGLDQKKTNGSNHSGPLPFHHSCCFQLPNGRVHLIRICQRLVSGTDYPWANSLGCAMCQSSLHTET